MSALGVTPATPDQLLSAALLTAADLPTALTTDGISDGASFETAVKAYQASGGVGVREQTWSASTPTPIYRLFDFRMLFPSPEQAQAYLDAAEPLLSEVAVSGLKPISDATTIGEGYRHYALQTFANEQPVALQNVLFRVGPMVAKVFVGGFGTTDEDVLGLARTAAARMTAALAGPPRAPRRAVPAEPRRLPPPATPPGSSASGPAQPGHAPPTAATAGRRSRPRAGPTAPPTATTGPPGHPPRRMARPTGWTCAMTRRCCRRRSTSTSRMDRAS